MNAILVFVALLGFALCELPTAPQPPQPLPELKKPGEVRPFRGMIEGKRPGRRGLFGKRFEKLNETEKAELEKKREEIKKEVREKMRKLIDQLNSALDKQTAILDDKALSRKDKLEQLRKLKEENPKVYNVLKAIFQQFVPKPKFGRRHGPRGMMRPFGRFGSQDRKSSRRGHKGSKDRKSSKDKPFGPKKLPELMKPMPAKLNEPIKA